MAQHKLTPLQAQRIELIEGFQKSLAHIKRLVEDLDSNRAARTQVLQDIGTRIAREFSQMRARAVASNIGTVADVAGQLSIVANRSSGLLMKIRALHDGVSSLNFQLDRALTQAQTPEKKQPSGTEPPPAT
jgi:predicted metal-dependent RNase